MSAARPEIRTFLCRSDNIGVLLRDPESGACASVDVPEAGPVLALGNRAQRPPCDRHRQGRARGRLRRVPDDRAIVAMRDRVSPRERRQR